MLIQEASADWDRLGRELNQESRGKEVSMFLCDTCVSRRKIRWFGIMDKVTVIIIRPKNGMENGGWIDNRRGNHFPLFCS